MAKFRSASRRISTTGSGCRHSQNAAAISATAAIEKNKTMKRLSNQSSVWPRSRTTSKHAKPRATRKIPRPSIRSLPPLRAATTSRVNSGGSETSRFVRIRDTIPMGMLIKKIHRQLQLSVIQPPSGGPLLRRKRVHKNGLLHRSEATPSDALQNAKEDEQAQ